VTDVLAGAVRLAPALPEGRAAITSPSAVVESSQMVGLALAASRSLADLHLKPGCHSHISAKGDLEGRLGDS
jgi:hypothetical protein